MPPDDWNADPLPEPPGLIRRLLDRLNVRTRAQLAGVDLLAAADLQGVGRTKVRALQEWRAEVLATAPPLAPEPRVHPERLSEPLTDAPGLLRSLLAELGIHTVGALAALDPFSVKDRSGVGVHRLAALSEYRQEVIRRSARAPGEAPEVPLPTTLAELSDAVLGMSKGRNRQIIARRLLDGSILSELGQEFGLSRERVRQIVDAALESARPRLQRRACELLEHECGWTGPESTVIHRRTVPAATVPFEHLRLPLELVFEGWALVDGDWFVHGGAPELERRAADVRSRIDGRRLVHGSDFAELGLPENLVAVLLEERCGLRRVGESEWTTEPEHETHAGFLVRRLQEEGAPMHQEMLARLLLERPVEPPVRGLERVVTYVERTFEREPAVFRTAIGTFVHRDALPLPEARLLALAARCVDRMRGSSRAFSTWFLLEKLLKDEPDAKHLNPWLLKELLKRHPEVKTLRKFLVGFAETLSEAGARRPIGGWRERRRRKRAIPPSTWWSGRRSTVAKVTLEAGETDRTIAE